MARKPSKTLTERELEIMRVLWALGEARLGDVHEALNRDGGAVAVSTVATQLTILVNKGYLTQQGRHGRYLYVPTSTREEVTRGLLDDFLDRVGLGRSPSFLIRLLAAEKLSAEDRAALRAILREAGPAAPRRQRAQPTGPDSSGEGAS
jgi:BlaI family penicillinase repressor